MANPNDKTGNFLNAIQKYADEQKHKIESEVERFKREELKKAEDEGLKDAYSLIQKEMGAMRIGITSEMAKREEKSKQALYQKRMEIVEDVFEKASGKLLDFTKTDGYAKLLIKSAQEIAACFDGHSCVLHIRKQDEAMKEGLLSCFSYSCSVEYDDSIKIGGIIGNCESLGIVADETLDTKLRDQLEWFLQHSGLRVV